MNAIFFSLPRLPAVARTFRYATLTLVLLLAVLTGCAPPAPQPSDAEQAVRTKITAESEGRIKLLQFKTTTPKPQDETSPYRWHYLGEIEFTEDCKWNFDRVKKVVHVSYRTTPITNEVVSGRLVKKGDRWQVEGNLAIEKDGEGWKSYSISLTKFKSSP